MGCALRFCKKFYKCIKTKTYFNNYVFFFFSSPNGLGNGYGVTGSTVAGNGKDAPQEDLSQNTSDTARGVPADGANERSSSEDSVGDVSDEEVEEANAEKAEASRDTHDRRGKAIDDTGGKDVTSGLCSKFLFFVIFYETILSMQESVLFFF